MQAFRLKYMGLMGTSGQGYVGQMGTVQEQIKDTRLELRVAEQTRDGIRQQLEEQTQRGPGAPSKRAATIKAPEIDSRINELKRQLDELMRKYTDQHPDVVGIKRQVAQLEDDRKREIEVRTKAAENEPGNALSGDPVAQQLKIALNDAEANVTTVRARLGRIRGTLQPVAFVSRDASQDRHGVHPAQPRLRDAEAPVRCPGHETRDCQP